MKRFILLFILLGALTAATSCFLEARSIATKPEPAATVPAKAHPTTGKTKIQVAILLDTSGSMQGLIEQAKSRLWNIVNTLTTLKFKGETPEIGIALYEYGNYDLDDEEYIRQITPLTTDLDLISKELFALRTGGSEEFCGAVINRAVKELEWGRNDADMKLIYIAGNEIFSQGSILYETAIAAAVKNNIYVNTIHCGSENMGIQDLWQDAAIKGKGRFFNIETNAPSRYIKTPFDAKIILCNEKLNDTYVSYGRSGQVLKVNQVVQDKNANMLSSANYAERTISKARPVYKNTNWDLVDRLKEDENALSLIKEEELPSELHGKSEAQIKEIIYRKEQERAAVRNEIIELATKRQEYIDRELEKDTTQPVDDLGKAITESILEYAQQKGYSMVNN